MIKVNRMGINMTGYMADHEAKIRDKLSQPDLSAEQLNTLHREHLLKISWLQHERLIHLLVTILVAVLLMFLFGLTLLNTSIPVLILLGIAAVLLMVYLVHYFNLENTVQRWYILADEIQSRLKGERLK